MDKQNKVLYFIDETHNLADSEEYMLSMYRMRMQNTWNQGWLIAKRYDERFDIEVGGITSNFTRRFSEESGIVEQDYKGLQHRPFYIVDYHDKGRRYSLEEAEENDNFPHQLVELFKSRIKQYEKHLHRIGTEPEFENNYFKH